MASAVTVRAYAKLDIQVKAVNYALCVDQAVSVLERNMDTVTMTKWNVFVKKVMKVLTAYTKPIVAALAPLY